MYSIAFRSTADLFSLAFSPTTMFFNSIILSLIDDLYLRSIALCAVRFSGGAFSINLEPGEFGQSFSIDLPFGEVDER